MMVKSNNTSAPYCRISRAFDTWLMTQLSHKTFVILRAWSFKNFKWKKKCREKKWAEKRGKESKMNPRMMKQYWQGVKLSKVLAFENQKFLDLSFIWWDSDVWRLFFKMILFCKPRQKSVSRWVIFFKYRFSTESTRFFWLISRFDETEIYVFDWGGGLGKLHDFNERSFPLACYASSGHQLSPLAS